MSELLIIYSKNEGEIFNRQSALGSYIHSLANLLSESFDAVYLNGIPIEKVSHEKGANEVRRKKSVKHFISPFIPSYFKAKIRDQQLLKNAGIIEERILKMKANITHSIEFLCLGSSISESIQEKFNPQSIIIYDAPLLEEYKFFQGREAVLADIFKSKIKKSLNAAHKVVVYSNPMKNHLIEHYDTAESKIAIHQNVDFSRFESFSERKEITKKEVVKLCFIGSFLKWHNVDQLVEVFEELIDELETPMQLFLIGDGMERQRIAALVDNSRHKTHITMTGFLDGEALYSIKKEMHVGIMPGSNWYGAPNKLFEYGAMKMACIAPNTPTISDIFNEKQVVFFENKSKESLKRAVLKLCQNRQVINQYSAAIYSKISQEYSSEITQSFYLNLLEKNGFKS